MTCNMNEWLKAIVFFYGNPPYHSYMSEQNADKYIVRFPDGLRQRLKDAANENGRSLNAEIVLRLQRSFDASGDDSDEVATQLWARAKEASVQWHCTPEDALEAILIAATSPGATEVVIIRPAPGMGVDDLARMFEVGRRYISRDAAITLHMPAGADKAASGPPRGKTRKSERR